MTKRVIAAMHDPKLVDDRDYVGNERLELAGQMLSRTAVPGNATMLSATSTPMPTSYKGAAGCTQIGLSMALIAALLSTLFAMTKIRPFMPEK